MFVSIPLNELFFPHLFNGIARLREGVGFLALFEDFWMDCVIVLDASEKATFKALSYVVAVTLNDIAVFASRLLRLLS